MRRAATLVELSVCLVLMGLILAAMTLGRGPPRPPAPPLAAMAEWILHDLAGAEAVLAPRVHPGLAQSSLEPALRLRLPAGEVAYRLDGDCLVRTGPTPPGPLGCGLVGIGFQLRAKEGRGAVVRVRLVAPRWVLLAGERVGGADHAP